MPLRAKGRAGGCIHQGGGLGGRDAVPSCPKPFRCSFPLASAWCRAGRKGTRKTHPGSALDGFKELSFQSLKLPAQFSKALPDPLLTSAAPLSLPSLPAANCTCPCLRAFAFAVPPAWTLFPPKAHWLSTGSLAWCRCCLAAWAVALVTCLYPRAC